MSGKGKGKSKRKDNIKPKTKEIILFDECINLERFAYDVIKYTALKFKVPESCIAAWKDKGNDYGCDDFLSVVCSDIIGNQIIFRHLYHTYFSKQYEENKLATPDFVGTLLFKLTKEVTCDFNLSPLSIVPISLSVACELFLFLYSKDMDLNPKKLAATWYECYLNIHKKNFERVGGLQEMYLGNYCSKCDVVDSFLNKFIDAHCLSYQASACNPDLKKLFRELAVKARDAYLSLSPKDTVEKVRELEQLCEVFARLTCLRIFETPPPHKATGSDLPKNAATPRIQVSQSNGSSAAAAASQILPQIVPEVQPWLLKSMTTEERTKKLKLKCPLQKDTRRLIMSSLEKKSSEQEPSVSIAAAQSYGQVPIPQDRVQKTGSYISQTEPLQQGIRQLALGSLGKQSSQKKPSVSTATVAAQSYKHQEAKPKDRVQNTGSSDL